MDSARVPPEPAEASADKIHDHVPRIGSRMVKKKWTNALEEDRPDDEMKENLRELRHAVVLAKPEPALDPKDDRQGAGNQEQIIEITVEKSRMDMWFQQKAIGSVSQAANETERISNVTEHQSRARITRPIPTASPSFKKSAIIIWILWAGPPENQGPPALLCRRSRRGRRWRRAAGM